jgi:hypothetical protein
VLGLEEMPTTGLTKRVIGELERLPAAEQDALAARWLEELADERLWSEKFEATSEEAWARLVASVKREIALSGAVLSEAVSLEDF